MVARGEGGAVFKEEVGDFRSAHEGGEMQGGVAVAVGLFDVGSFFEKQGGDFGFAVVGGAGERCHAIVAVTKIDDVTFFKNAFDTQHTAAGDDSFETVADLLGIISRSFDEVAGFVGDVEDEVVAKKAGGVLHLKEMQSFGRKRFELD